MTLANRFSSSRQTATGLLLGYAVDAVVGDPQRGHPVAAFGRLAAWTERRTYASRRGPGVAHVVLLVGGAAALGAGVERLSPSPAVRVVVTAAATWAVLGGRSLRHEAAVLAGQLDRDDLAAARVQVTHLVGRDPSRLDGVEIARACVESVAENTSDAVVAPLLWGAVAGVPGLLAYRAANTLDAMVGHRSERYLHFGWAAARLDDLLNLAPARLAGLLAALAAPLVGGSPRAALGAARRDARRHPSPNAGVVEAAFAGALGVRLGGVNVYEGHAEDRGTLGDGRAVEVGDVARSVRLSRATSLLSLGVSVGVALLVRRPPWNPSSRSFLQRGLSVGAAPAGHRRVGNQGRPS
jgi:adenosylcobinamide-phosphate synthase